MAITATNEGGVQTREQVPSGNHVARCVKMIHIGTVNTEYLGEVKVQNKIRIGWELPNETRVFNPDKGEQPMVIENTYTLSMHEKASLRAMLQNWRGKAFTDEEAKGFDVTKLLGVPCMLNVIHKPSKDGQKVYANISGVTPLPKGFVCPEQVNPTFELNYDEFDKEKFDSLPKFIQEEMQDSVEYKKMNAVSGLSSFMTEDTPNNSQADEDDQLPF